MLLGPVSLMCLRLLIGQETPGFPVEQANQRLLTKDSRCYTRHDCLSGRRRAAIRLKISLYEMKASVVSLILDSKTEEALDLLSKWYKVPVPKLGVGVVEGKTKGVAAVYSLRRKEILAASREYLYDPFVMIHEFYHHLRSVSGRHRGTEKDADRFALDFIEAYRVQVAGLGPRD
jgi:hypothetical protein